MEKTARIYIAGHRGLVGSALVRVLEQAGYTHLLKATHAELDLCDSKMTAAWFKREQPEFVLLAAARVGGIYANNSYPADFIRDNLAIQQNVITAAYNNGVRQLLFLGSSCIYPRDCPKPIREDYLLTGPLEATNRPYALAKIAGIEMCWAYNRQYGTRYLAVMPTNLYGPGDNYDLNNSHVLPALIRKMHTSKQRQEQQVVIWGSGTPRREFLYSEDLAHACLFLLKQPWNNMEAVFNAHSPPLINIGYGSDLSIVELAKMVAEVVGFAGILEFDATKPDGTLRKWLDVSRMEHLGWRATTPLRTGITRAYQDFLHGSNRQ